MSRSVWLRHDEDRAESQNDGTICFHAVRGVAPLEPMPPGSFEDVFRRDYAVIRRILGAHTEPGLALVVASRAGIEASAWVNAEDDGINPLIIGRHNAAEIFLPSDPALSLRHLAVILHRRGTEPVRFRVLDLRTATAFEDERGRRLEALESTGPTLLRCASFCVLLFPTGEPGEPWPEDSAEAWRRLPERVHLESASADPERWAHAWDQAELRLPDPIDNGSPTTTCVSFPGPVFPSPLLAGVPSPVVRDAGPARGEILLTSRWGRAALRLGKEAARQGVLLGRYERCDGGGLPLLSSPKLSRVHLLIVEVGATLCAIDTASRNGSRLGDRRIRHARLEPGRPIILAEDISVEWHPFH
jgi:hypothetical protein